MGRGLLADRLLLVAHLLTRALAGSWFRAAIPRMRMDDGLKRFRNHCGLIEIARGGFPWEKTTKRPAASVYTNCETATAAHERSRCRPGQRKFSCRHRSPKRSTVSFVQPS